MENFSKRAILDRLKVELRARGISLRKLDELLGIGKRQLFQPGKDRPIPLDDILEILRVTKIDSATFFGQIAGYGHPFEIAALRGKGEPKWTKSQSKTLRSLRWVELRGSRGFEPFRNRLREMERLREDDPARADGEIWSALAELREPGALVGLLSLLAINSSRSQAHHLLGIAIDLLAGDLQSSAGAKLTIASGRCFLKASRIREGLGILERYALPIAARFGAAEDHATVLMHIAHAEALLGVRRTDTLWKAVEVGDERTSFAALQVIAGHELEMGDPGRAAQMYDELLELAYFPIAPKLARAAIGCSRLAAHSLAGNLGPDSLEEFRRTVAEARSVLSARDQVTVLMDLVLFLAKLGKEKEAQQTLEAELWQVLDLEDEVVKRRFAELWEKVGLPKDSRYQTLILRIERTAESDGSLSRRGTK